MSARDDLLESIAGTIRSYRAGQWPEPSVEHVDRWAQQFTADGQLPFLREFAHVIDQTFITEGDFRRFLSNLVHNENLAGPDPVSYWARANLLQIQRDGAPA